MLVASEQLVQIAIFPPWHAVGQQNPQMIADDFVRHRVIVIGKVRFSFDRFDANNILLPASLFSRHGESDPAVAARARESDRLSIDFTALVPQQHLSRSAIAILAGNNDVDDSRILFSDRGRGLHAK
jgi:hypothetical protein